jgi:hypothetical protein
MRPWVLSLVPGRKNDEEGGRARSKKTTLWKKCKSTEKEVGDVGRYKSPTSMLAVFLGLLLVYISPGCV